AEQERLAIEALRTGTPVLALHTRPETPHEADGPEPVGVELLIALRDRPGVLPAAAGVLALHRLTVRAADLRAVELPTELGDSADLLLLSWRVAAEYGALPRA
ncbi:[protein-PII] uridylyltransferase, partial [Streptomyces sp. DT225]